MCVCVYECMYISLFITCVANLGRTYTVLDLVKIFPITQISPLHTHSYLHTHTHLQLQIPTHLTLHTHRYLHLHTHIPTHSYTPITTNTYTPNTTHTQTPTPTHSHTYTHQQLTHIYTTAAACRVTATDAMRRAGNAH